MKDFIHHDFLLQNKTSRQLYHEVAAGCPIVDYHNHLHPPDLAHNRHFDNIASLWVCSDQYKHRAMRMNGIPEKYITGSAPDKEKFMMWAKTMPKTIGNPLFHWSCLELTRIFDIGEILTPSNAGDVWDTCNAIIAEQNLGIIELLKRWKVETLCTSDDLLDDLGPHKQATAQEDGVEVWPSLRGDSILAFGHTGFASWLVCLEEQTGIEARDLPGYKSALAAQLDKFSEAGCRFADHALDAGFKFVDIPEDKANALFLQEIADGAALAQEDLTALKSHCLKFLGEEYAKKGWNLQLHIGAQRHTSTRLRNVAGPAGGFATVGNSTDIESLCGFFDALEISGNMPGIILYNLNPNDNAAFATLTGSFVHEGVPGKIQFGPAWWYNDHFDGITAQLKALSHHGLLGHFIGMTSDSRSALSFSRHEYFRRVLCNVIGGWVEKGHLPNDFELLAEVVRNICYHNIKNRIGNKAFVYGHE